MAATGSWVLGTIMGKIENVQFFLKCLVRSKTRGFFHDFLSSASTCFASESLMVEKATPTFAHHTKTNLLIVSPMSGKR